VSNKKNAQATINSITIYEHTHRDYYKYYSIYY